MKKLICLLGHPKRIMKVNECEVERLENDDKVVRMYTCNYCKEIVAANVICNKFNPKIMELNFDDPNMYD